MCSAPSLEIFCPAKLNVALSIGSADASQGGLHSLATWMVALDFGDVMTISETRGTESTFDITFEDDSGKQVDWPLEVDLAYRAHGLLREHIGRDLVVDLRIRKRIPPESGLGGGSSNAAAALVGLNRFLDLGLDTSMMHRLGHRLGSDVPFLVSAVSGEPSAVVSGLGEIVEPAQLAAPIYFVLMFPPFGSSTRDTYTVFDQLNPDAGAPDFLRVSELAGRAGLEPNGPFNDLAEPTCYLQPKLRSLMRGVQQKLGDPVHLTGSGSTLFVVAPDKASASVLAQRARTVSELQVIVARLL